MIDCQLKGLDCTDLALECERHQAACKLPVPPCDPVKPRSCPEADDCYKRLTECSLAGRDCADLKFECERYEKACEPPVDPAVKCREAIAACSDRYSKCTSVPGQDCSDVRQYCSDLAARCQP